MLEELNGATRTSNVWEKKAEAALGIICEVFARWLPVKQNNLALVCRAVDHALGRKKEKKTSKTENSN